jgi:hypothetical protein
MSEAPVTLSNGLRYPDILGSVKVLVSLDDRLLRRIDRAAKDRGISRSAYLAELCERDLGLARGPGASSQARAALRRLDRMFTRLPHDDPVDAIRAERDAHA